MNLMSRTDEVINDFVKDVLEKFSNSDWKVNISQSSDTRSLQRTTVVTITELDPFNYHLPKDTLFVSVVRFDGSEESVVTNNFPYYVPSIASMTAVKLKSVLSDLMAALTSRDPLESRERSLRNLSKGARDTGETVEQEPSVMPNRDRREREWYEDDPHYREIMNLLANMDVFSGRDDDEPYLFLEKALKEKEFVLPYLRNLVDEMEEGVHHTVGYVVNYKHVAGVYSTIPRLSEHAKVCFSRLVETFGSYMMTWVTLKLINSKNIRNNSELSDSFATIAQFYGDVSSYVIEQVYSYSIAGELIEMAGVRI